MRRCREEGVAVALRDGYWVGYAGLDGGWWMEMEMGVYVGLLRGLGYWKWRGGGGGGSHVGFAEGFREGMNTNGR